MTVQERSIFLLKRFLPVMLLLTRDVFAHGGDIRFGNRKCTIADLPCKSNECITLGFDPFRRRLLDIFHSGADGGGASQFKENVDVISD